MESPLAYPPHSSQHPIPIIAMRGRFINEITLVAPDPLVCIGAREVPVSGSKLADKVAGFEALIALRIELNSRAERGFDVG